MTSIAQGDGSGGAAGAALLEVVGNDGGGGLGDNSLIVALRDGKAKYPVLSYAVSCAPIYRWVAMARC
jgi:hypothetical protein